MVDKVLILVAVSQGGRGRDGKEVKFWWTRHRSARAICRKMIGSRSLMGSLRVGSS
jgi:hypothetical protein